MRLAIASSHPIQYYAPLCRELAGRLHVHVFFAHRATPEQQGAAGFGTPFEWDVDLTSGYDHTFLRNVATRPGTDHFGGCDTPEIGERLKAGRFDALLVLGWGLKSFAQAIVAAKRLGIPVLVRGDSQLATPRSELKRLAKALLYPPLLRTFDAALYVGERSQAYYRHYRYPAERLFFSPHCVDTQWFSERATEAARSDLRDSLGIGPSTRLILFAGKLTAFKRPLDVIETCARLRGQGLDAQMLVAGSGELEGELGNRAASLGAPLHRLGFCNQTRMPAVYAAADLLMLPSDGRETWGLVCNEALACGRPILVSDAVGCAPDLAADGEVGASFPLGDLDAAAAAASLLLSAPPGAAAIAQRSAAHGLKAAADGVMAALDHVKSGRNRLADRAQGR
jgi:glycosyltransferase involved in cell wall biosynthesis